MFHSQCVCVFAVCHVYVEIVPAAGEPHLAGLGSALSSIRSSASSELCGAFNFLRQKWIKSHRHSDSQWAQAANGGTFLLVISASLYRHS